MEEDELIDAINELDRQQQAWADEFDLALVAALALLAEQAMRLVDRLQANGRATTTETVGSNLRAVTMWRAELPALLEQAGFSRAVDTLLAHLGEGAGRLNAYYTRLAPAGRGPDTFVASRYEGVVTALAAQTRALLARAIETGVSAALGEALTWQVLSRATGAEMRTAIRTVLDVNGVNARSVSTTASDALYTFSRGYSLAVAEGLNLRHYYYMGTQIAGTRAFCSARLGKAFTQGEVESWAGQNWAGKIPGTSVVTIFWYAGGYRCRHRILPVSKSMYNYLKSNQSN